MSKPLVVPENVVTYL